MLVDDHPIVREGMSKYINLREDLSVCCEASDVEEAISISEKSKPDLIIIDLSLNNGSGLNLIKRLRHQHPDIFMLVVSMHDENIYAEQCLKAGANGYLMKSESAEYILKAIDKIAGGEVYLSDRMLNKLALNAKNTSRNVPVALGAITEREFEILHLIGLGFGPSEIAEKLNRSVKTVQAHRENIKRKLGLKNTADLIKCALSMECG